MLILPENIIFKIFNFFKYTSIERKQDFPTNSVMLKIFILNHLIKLFEQTLDKALCSLDLLLYSLNYVTFKTRE